MILSGAVGRVGGENNPVVTSLGSLHQLIDDLHSFKSTNLCLSTISFDKSLVIHRQTMLLHDIVPSIDFLRITAILVEGNIEIFELIPTRKAACNLLLSFRIVAIHMLADVPSQIIV